MTRLHPAQYSAWLPGLNSLLFGLVLCLILMLPVSASVASPFYTAEVPAEQTRQQWQREAFEQVIRRIAADPDVLSHPVVQQERQRANTYVKQFEAIRTEQGPKVRVLIDQEKIQQLFREQQLLIWDTRRPQVLIWLVQQEDYERRFVSQRQHELVAAMQQQAQQHLLPLIWPLYDMEDLLNLNETDVWAGFWQQIRTASARYQPDLIVTVQLSASNTEQGLTHQLFWQLDHQGRVERFELTGQDPVEVAAKMIDALAAQLAQRYAVRYLTESEPLELSISGTDDWSDWVRLQRLLESFPGVGQVDIKQRDATNLRVNLRLAIPQQEWLQLVALEPSLSLLSNQSVESFSLRAPAGSEPIRLHYERR